MKKILLFVFSLIAFLTLSFNINVSADNKSVTAGGGTYQVTSHADSKTLQYGLNYFKDIAESKSLNMVSSKNEFNPQVINAVEVPTSNVIKVVNWTYSSRTVWTKQTIKNMAKDFERNNPGWIVIAGINGDFFDINGGGALPYQTTSAAVNNGDVVKARGNSSTSYQQVGFTNDGTTNSLIGGKKYETNSYHTLAIYSEDKIIKEYKIDKLNETPTGNEISLYFSYNYFDESSNRTIHTATVGENSYTVTAPIRGYGDNSENFFCV